MSMQDTLADMLTRIRNGLVVTKKEVCCPYTKLKQAVLQVLKEQGYITDFRVEQLADKKVHQNLVISLKYHHGKPVINRIERASRSSLRKYSSAAEMPEVKNRLGIAIVTTSQGVMTGRHAKQQKLGGEIICYVD